MPGKKGLALTDRQYRLLELLWRHGPMTVRDALAHMPEGTPYTTALGLFQNMEKAGLVRAEKEAGAHRYAPVPDRHQATADLLRDFVSRFFGGSAKRLAIGLIEAGELRPEELKRLQEELDRAEPGASSAPPSSGRSTSPARTRKGKS
jgi:predicted transcriptional regulator